MYWFEIGVGDLAGEDAILGMDFMVPAGARMDLADDTMCFPDECGSSSADGAPVRGQDEDRQGRSDNLDRAWRSMRAI